MNVLLITKHVMIYTPLRDGDRPGCHHRGMMSIFKKIEVGQKYVHTGKQPCELEKKPCVGTTLLRDRILVETIHARGRACPDSASS